MKWEVKMKLQRAAPPKRLSIHLKMHFTVHFRGGNYHFAVPFL